MVQHTSGPWSIDEWGSVNGPDGRTIEINGVASVCSPGVRQDIAKANARLIAAAPELLEALQKSAVALEEASKLLYVKGLQGCASIMMGHRDIARAAIARATGAAS